MDRVSRRDFLRAGAAGAAGAVALGAGGLELPDDLAAGAASTKPPSRHALRQLQRQLKGRLLLPGDPGYLQASTPANGRYRSVRPVAVAECADEADVVTCVNWVRRNGVMPVARGGGHSYAGYSTTTGLMISMKAINDVKVDTQNATVSCGGAALNKNFYDVAVNGPLFLPGGTCFGVGVGGLALGGGIGYQTHWAGLTCDHMLSSRIVTASGDVLQLSPTENADLFWACRGGAGGSFGINTAFEFSLVEKPETVSWYRFDWRGAEAAEAVLYTFNNLIAKAPAALNAVAAATAVKEEGAEGPRDAIEVFSRGQYIGPLDELKDLVQPLIDAAGTPLKSELRPIGFWEVVKIISTIEPPSHGFGDISRYAVDPLPRSAVTELVDLVSLSPSRDNDNNGSIWSLGWVGGSVVDKYARTDMAYVHRGVSTLMRPTTVWDDDADPSVGRDLNDWTNAVIDVLNPYTPNESYQNFPNRMISDWQQAYYAENFPRLVEVKTKYDPGNLFQNAQSIPVAAS
ncbi:MAG TPA: FAD-binding oxidoreductase [Acidimicrobiales bacterium]|nr:FAD-binding oxidoreductase [Acidimicrobiales bacterium]